MNTAICHREDELLDALGRGFVGAELTAHLDECTSCSELHLVAGGLLEVRADAITHAPIPSAGTMLWRMQMRKRREAQAAARRTLFVGQAVTLMIGIALTALIFGSDMAVGVREAIAAVRIGTPIALAIATSVLLAPLAGWVVARQK